MATQPGNIEAKYIRSLDAKQERAVREEEGRKLEEPFRRFLEWAGRNLGIVKKVEAATETEDHEGVDAFIVFENGELLAVQLTSARDVSIRLQKIHDVLQNRPTVSNRYDNAGRRLPLPQPVLRVLLYAKPDIWNEAAERHAQGLPPERYFRNPRDESNAILEQLRVNLLQHKTLRGELAKRCDTYLEIIGKEAAVAAG